MIRRISANHPTFKTVDFGPGMNIIWADRTKDSTKKDSRNGLGKSTLIEIIHFCLGARLQQGKGLAVPALEGWAFTIELDVMGVPVRATRSLRKPQHVTIDGDIAGVTEEQTLGLCETPLAVEHWRDWLGQQLFGLPARKPNTKYNPSFRSLIPYFVRKDKDAFSTAFEHHRKQREWEKQISNAYLLELNWEDAVAFQTIKDRRKGIEELKRAAANGAIKDFIGTLGDLKARRVRLAEKAEAEAGNLREFRVHADYVSIREEANRLTSEIHESINANTAAQRMLDLYRRSQAEEAPPAVNAIARLYADAGVNLPGVTLRAIDEVRSFHETVIRNRRSFLDEEAKRLSIDIDRREKLIGEKTDRRAKLMSVLSTHGALEEFTLLQLRHMDTVSELKAVENLISNVNACQTGLSQVKIDQELLLQKARRDLDERGRLRDKAIALFNSYSERLYSAPGRLVIDPAPTGFRFDIEIDRSGSSGIGNMKVFCYDLMLARLWSSRPTSPGFIVHDSTIFDGVDERQRALALELAATEAVENRFQYICTLNSDYIPWSEFSSNFNPEKYVRLRLTDADISGCLLGVRF